KRNWVIIGCALLVVAILVGTISLLGHRSQKEMSYLDFMKALDERQVSQVVIKNNEKLVIELLTGDRFIVPNPLKADLKETLLLRGVTVKSSTLASSSGPISSVIILLVVFGVIFFSRKGNNDNKELIRDVHKKNEHPEKLIKFEQVAGNYEAKEMVKDIIDFIKEPEKYEGIGAKMPRGVLLYGLPGTGKTLLAKAIAGEADVPFYAMSGSDFVQMYVGVGANRIRQLFKTARKSEKAVIFIDEIDALGKSRGSKTNSANDEREQTLNALLTEMSGFHTSQGIVVIGATNRADTLDAALLRPGRFDRQIEVALPDQVAREEILHLYLKQKPIAEDVDVHQLSKNTVSFSGAMLEHLVNEAAIGAANKGDNVIQMAHLDKAFYTVVAGMEKKNHKLLANKEEQKITAYHEAGHALVSRLLLPETEVAKVSIIPTTKGVAGYNYNIPQDKMFKRKGEILSNIMVLLGGRAAESLIFGEDNVTTGAMNDIKVASEELYNYFKKYGMDEDHGLFSLEIANALDDVIYEQCREKMKTFYQDTKALLFKNEKSLILVAELLIQKEAITGDEIDDLLFRVTKSVS
ncbi:MAG: ATP-dependent zinc metalloprotease FtsH, partial [Vallitaleaceae bacterium]|nr:ATP-dependent zinc metalloprotease FtsH [Vallitaleaceae bacterium]